MHAKPLIENCRNCGASPEPVCSYCGTVHDGITYKERNRPPVVYTKEEEDALEKFYFAAAQLGVKLNSPLSHSYIIDVYE